MAYGGETWDAFADREGADEGVGGAGKGASECAVSGCASGNAEVLDEDADLAVESGGLRR